MNERQFQSYNERRIYLINKKVDEKLNEQETMELAQLMEICQRYVNQRFPLPKFNDEQPETD